jgi:hypothetical protein
MQEEYAYRHKHTHIHIVIGRLGSLFYFNEMFEGNCLHLHEPRNVCETIILLWNFKKAIYLGRCVGMV